MSLSLRNRIASLYIAITAVLIGLLFIIIYYVVSRTVYSYLDNKLKKESAEVQNGLFAGGDTVKIINNNEWNEREHSQIEVNPAFLSVTDMSGSTIRKSENLNGNFLEFRQGVVEMIFFNGNISEHNLRQAQIPLKNQSGKVTGYIQIGLPMDDSLMLLSILRVSFITGYISALLILFIFARWFAGKSIKPMQNVISSAENISRSNLDNRIKLPENDDEIYKLTSTINSLLDRLEDAVLREKQFTSDASHELRTPLAIIKGTLEVLIRKPRDTKHYEEKISFCIMEVDRMTSIIDQLLILARYESGKIEPKNIRISLNDMLKYSVLRAEQKAFDKEIEINFNSGEEHFIFGDPSMLELIFDNLISNAIKYSNGSRKIDININSSNDGLICVIKDYGIGMNETDLKQVFERFYRSESARNTKKQGDGIGLAIVKKLSDLQNINISISSVPDKGTEVSLKFNKIAL